VTCLSWWRIVFKFTLASIGLRQDTGRRYRHDCNNKFHIRESRRPPWPQRPAHAGTAVASTAHRYNQDEVSRELTEFAEPGFMRFAETTGVDHRSLALPLPRYSRLNGFTEANDAYLEVAVDLGEQAITKALAAANIEPHGVDTIVMVSSTGIAVPTIDARLMSRIGFRPDIKRVPLFGLGCVGGAAGMARVYDYLHGYPEHVALLLCRAVLAHAATR
jgi:predicted naringenin-chalcone synthase